MVGLTSLGLQWLPSQFLALGSRLACAGGLTCRYLGMEILDVETGQDLFEDVDSIDNIFVYDDV